MSKPRSDCEEEFSRMQNAFRARYLRETPDASHAEISAIASGSETHIEFSKQCAHRTARLFCSVLNEESIIIGTPYSMPSTIHFREREYQYSEDGIPGGAKSSTSIMMSRKQIKTLSAALPKVPSRISSARGSTTDVSCGPLEVGIGNMPHVKDSPA